VLHRPKAPPTLAGGFGAGWHALRVAVSWTLAFLGAIAPFAVVLAVAGYLVYRGRRWLARRRPATGPASPES
jgi:membrane protein implicated in regulation of membrane protease activity